MTKSNKGKNEEHKAASKPEEPHKRSLLLFYQEPIVGFTAWLAIFTFTLAVIAAVQVWAFVQSERAFVSAASVKFISGLESNHPIEVAVEFRNSGKSTAFVKDAIFSWRAGEAKKDLPPIPEYVAGAYGTPGPLVSGANATARVPLRGLRGAPELIFTEADTSAIRAGNISFYIYGFIVYTDEFSFWGSGYTTGYCFKYDPRQLATATFHNCNERAYTYAR